MKKYFQSLMIGLLCFSLLACDGMSKQDVGVISGGVIGGIVGSQFGYGGGQMLAIAGGTVAGALIGGAIGNSMDRQDRLEAAYALEHTETGHTKVWRNPDNGRMYEVTPVRTYYEPHMGVPEPCREYRTNVIIDGQRQVMYGTACRNPDGTWQAVNG